MATSEEVRKSIEMAKTHLEAAAEHIVWQIENRAWEALGYADWDEMREAEYGGAAVIVPRVDRPQLVKRLRTRGLTQQSVADTVGVTRRTAQADEVKAQKDALTPDGQSGEDEPVIVTNARGQQRPATYRKPDPVPEPEPTDADLEADLEAAKQDRRDKARREAWSKLRMISTVLRGIADGVRQGELDPKDGSVGLNFVPKIYHDAEFLLSILPEEQRVYDPVEEGDVDWVDQVEEFLHQSE